MELPLRLEECKRAGLVGEGTRSSTGPRMLVEAARIPQTGDAAG